MKCTFLISCYGALIYNSYCVMVVNITEIPNCLVCAASIVRPYSGSRTFLETSVSTRLLCVTSEKTVTFIVTAGKTCISDYRRGSDW
jgi:hypothetical protein